MEQDALTDILTLDERQIGLVINRLNHLKQGIYRFSIDVQDRFNTGSGPIDLDWVSTQFGKPGFEVVYDEIFADQAQDNELHQVEFTLPLLHILYWRENSIMSVIIQISMLGAGPGSNANYDDYFAELKENNNKVNSSVTSYEWADDTDSPRELYKLMNNVFIVDTSENDFISAFSKHRIGSFSPIRWRNDVMAEVVYFINALIDTGLINDSSKPMNYQRLIGCISKSDGTPFLANSLASANQKLHMYPAQDKKDIIDNMLIAT